MKNTDLRTEFTAETQKRFNVEWIAYNDYVDWLEQRLVKLLTIPPVINCPNAGGKNKGSIGANVLHLTEVGDYEAQNLNYSQT